MLFQPHQRLLFIGDSITDAGRVWEPPYGSGYVNIVRNMLMARYPASNWTVLNRGVGGNTVRHLALRWESDVVAERPSWLTVMIGINDVWRHFAFNASEAVPLAEFQETLRRLLLRARDATGCGLILMTPYMIEPDTTHPMRSLMDTYGNAVALIASELNAPLVRTQAAFDAVLLQKPWQYWAPDQIHPGGPGHAVLALEYLRTVGADF